MFPLESWKNQADFPAPAAAGKANAICQAFAALGGCRWRVFRSLQAPPTTCSSSRKLWTLSANVTFCRFQQNRQLVQLSQIPLNAERKNKSGQIDP